MAPFPNPLIGEFHNLSAAPSSRAAEEPERIACVCRQDRETEQERERGRRLGEKSTMNGMIEVVGHSVRICTHSKHVIHVHGCTPYLDTL